MESCSRNRGTCPREKVLPFPKSVLGKYTHTHTQKARKLKLQRAMALCGFLMLFLNYQIKPNAEQGESLCKPALKHNVFCGSPHLVTADGKLAHLGPGGLHATGGCTPRGGCSPRGAARHGGCSPRGLLATGGCSPRRPPLNTAPSAAMQPCVRNKTHTF